ncbi:hypothetical protein KC902_00245 [Candidatus Kaiserbacteria bacterium]|nr:hypothetical protein [Candidatus Kaiserbacteria bacterium]
MSYNREELPRYVRTAGKITIVTALAGLLVFMVAFMFDVGTQEFNRVSAQTATTTLTVLNTPPQFTLNAHEQTESSTSTPTNSGDQIVWNAIGEDSNGAPYFLLICSTNASPTANQAADAGSLGTAPPDCGVGATQWAVSTSTTSGAVATAATTTTEAAPFAEIQEWYAWVCDDDPFNPRCNNIPVQGYSATNSSPFNVNSRPVLTDFGNDGPADPGATLVFHSTSSDPDVVGGEDAIYLVVCSSNTDYNATLNTCPNDFIASTTITILSDASATYTLPAIIRDDTYAAYGYIVDEHGHEATANPLNQDFDVNNVAPVVLSGDIDLNGGSDITLTIPAGETPSTTLDFTIRDANSCLTAASTTDEIASFTVSIFRSGVGTTTCDGSAGSYDPNNCYPSGVPTATWNLSCTATTTCASPLQDYMDYTCEFPLWFIADPTDSGPETPAALAAQNWSAGVSGTDDDGLTGPMSTTSNPVELNSFTAIDIESAQIAYGSIEPGSDSGTLSATSSALNVGNTGLDQEVRGDSMCGTYSPSTPCSNSATSTIPDDQQKFASTSLSYASGLAFALSSTTNQEVELNIPKTTGTSSASWEQDYTYWGIAVPVAITLAGNYQGLNTFTAKTAEAIDW